MQDDPMNQRRPLPEHLKGQAFSTEEALQIGVKPHRLRARDLAAPFPGSRIPADRTEDFPTRCRAYATVCSDDVVFATCSAARLLNIPLPRELETDCRVHVLALRSDRAPRGKNVVGHKTNTRPEIIDVEGLRVTSPIDTWLSLGQILSLDDLIVAGDFLVGLPEPLVELDELVARARTLTHVRGARRIRAAIAEVRACSRSPRETRVRLAVVRSGLPEPELNARIILPGGAKYHGDLVYPWARIVFEYDSEHHRLNDRQWALDLSRYNDFSAAGWIVIRIPKHFTATAIVAAAKRALRSRGYTGQSREGTQFASAPRAARAI